MKLLWHDVAWDDYLYWHTHDKQAVKRIHMLIKDIQRNGYVGIGKPEPLKYSLTGSWSRRINLEHRIVYEVIDEIIYIESLRGHY